VKRKDILQKLKKAGFSLVEGGKHTKVYDATGKHFAAIGRHVALDDWMVRKIEKQCGVKIL
jgi:hypothetical protein